MKNCRLIILLLLLLSPTLSRAQTDTIQDRSLIMRLNDGTQFIYELSNVEIRRGLASQYLGFQSFSPGNSYTTQWFKTTPFIGTGGVDSIFFDRLFNYADTLFDHGTNTYDSTNVDSMAAQVFALRTHAITPNAVFFPSTGSIKYILQLRRASDDSILYPIDTVNCYVNSGGHLRYSTTNNTPDLRLVTRFIPSGMVVYLGTKMESSLPGFAVQSYTPYSFLSEPISLLARKLYGIYQDNVTPPSPKIGNKKIHDNPTPTIATVHWNTNTINIELEARIADHYRFELKDINGRTVHTEHRDIAEGPNQFTINNIDLPSGSYYLTIISSSMRESHKLSIVK